MAALSALAYLPHFLGGLLARRDEDPLVRWCAGAFLIIMGILAWAIGDAFLDVAKTLLIGG